MTLPRLRATAWWVLLACFGLGVLSLPVSAHLMQNPFLFVPMAAETAVGALVARRRPWNPMGWVFLGVGALCGLLSAAVALTYLASERTGPVPWWGVLGAWVGSWVWYPLLYAMTTLTILLFPSGLASRRWRPVLWVSATATGAVVVLAALQPTLALGFGPDGVTTSTVANPLSPFRGTSWVAEELPIAPVLGVVSLLCALAAVMSVVLRTRRARGTERLQMRWFSFAVAVIVAEVLLEIVFQQYAGSPALSFAEAAALSFVPIACGIAILRYRLYEIDRIISRTASYALVTGLLLAVYFVIVTSVTTLLPQSSNGFAVATATLAAAAAFRPLLSRVQRAVDRRFDRERYDGLRAAEAFSARLRDETDPAAVSAELAAVVQRTLQPGRLLLWIPGDVADER